MANVVLAHDEELGRLVAIKLLDEQLAAAGDFRARFTREEGLAAGLSHPNIVTVFDAGEAEAVRTSSWSTSTARRSRSVCATTAHLIPTRGTRDRAAGRSRSRARTSHGLVHRDLKPGNLIQRSDGTVKIADFGIARGSHGTELTEAGTILGTAAYLAPEQAEGGRVTPPTDLYALGVVLHELPDRRAALAGGLPRRHRPAPHRAGPSFRPAFRQISGTRSRAHSNPTQTTAGERGRVRRPARQGGAGRSGDDGSAARAPPCTGPQRHPATWVASAWSSCCCSSP